MSDECSKKRLSGVVNLNQTIHFSIYACIFPNGRPLTAGQGELHLTSIKPIAVLVKEIWQVMLGKLYMFFKSPVFSFS